MTMHPYVILDVFTDAPLQGNQLAVFTAGGAVPEELMQRTARELNLSETVFVLDGDDQADARIRIFTPGAELPFAGHPTLGSAFVVGERNGLSLVRLRTGSGIVPVSLERAGGVIVAGEMEQPIPKVMEFERGEELLQAVGVSSSVLPIEAYDNGPVYAYVTLESEQQVAEVQPDLRALGRFGELGVSVVAGSGSNFKTRMFGPGLGVVEDPATGSAAGPLALHLARHGVIDFGQQIEIRQGEEIARPSRLLARVLGDGDRVEKVLVGGSAVVVAEGRYRLN
jgi:trans-2,3-dihydro-3-hydroxyanthranilate isomerase